MSFDFILNRFLLKNWLENLEFHSTIPKIELIFDCLQEEFSWEQPEKKDAIEKQLRQKEV